jgi:hypothetical protein
VEVLVRTRALEVLLLVSAIVPFAPLASQAQFQNCPSQGALKVCEISTERSTLTVETGSGAGPSVQVVSWLVDGVEQMGVEAIRVHDEEMQARDIQAMGDTVAPAVLNLAYRMIAATAARMPAAANAVVSNLPGAPVPLYMAGGRVEATYPISIIMPGMGLNVTAVSYLDQIDFGFTVDPDLVPDPWYLAEGVPIALDQLKAAAGIDHSVPLRADPQEQ